MRQKIIFLDVDGTLVDYYNTIPDSAIKAVQEARKKGHLVYVCTGRSRSEMPEAILTLGFDGMIGGNGSYLEHHGKVLMHQKMLTKDVNDIVDWLQKRGLEFYLESHNGLFASKNFREHARPVFRTYAMRKGKSEDDVKSLEAEDALYGLIYNGGEPYPDDVKKVSFILKSYQDHLDSIKAFPHLEAHTWDGRGETALFGDLGIKGINKAIAIDVLLTHLALDREDTIAFGDAKIDIPMLDYCKIGVAMGNGGPEILEIADMITDDVEENGLYNAFKTLGLWQ